MDLTYSPDGEEPRTWSIKPAQMMSPEAEAIEEVGGNAWDTFEQWQALLPRGHARAERAALWILLRRENKALSFADVSYPQQAVIVRWDDDDRRLVRARIRELTLTDEERQEWLASIPEPAGGDDPGPLEPSDSPSEQPDSRSDEPSTSGP